MYVDRYAAPVVHNRDGIVDVDRYTYFCTEACQSLINRVIDYFVDEMMEADFTGRPDVHGRSEPNGFQTLQNLDATRIVIFVLSHCRHTFDQLARAALTSRLRSYA